jgi:ATP-dependent RNA helicase DDX27
MYYFLIKVNDLIRLSLVRPVRLHVDSNTAIASRLSQEFIRIRKGYETSKPAILAALCTRTFTSNTLVFFRTKALAHYTKTLFDTLGISAAELHGNLNQKERLESLEKFKSGQVAVLLATDLASRGLDISGIQTVINYDMPTTYEVYIHRVGRTGNRN